MYRFISLALFFSLTCTIAFAVSYPQILDRCTEDNLGANEAIERNEWARKCFPTLVTLINFHNDQTPRSYMLAKNEKTGSWQAPREVKASCDGWKAVAFCVASCYPGDQLITFSVGSVAIEDAVNERLSDIVSLSKHSTLDGFSFVTLPVRNYTRSWQDGQELIRHFYLKSGGTISVTDSHPMLRADSVMKTAKEMQVGEQMLRKDGLRDEIVAIEDVPFFGKVYNVAPDSGDPLENIVVAQNYLTGSAAYQYLEQFSTLMGRKMMRESIEIP